MNKLDEAPGKYNMCVVDFIVSEPIDIRPVYDRWYSLPHDLIISVLLKDEGWIVYNFKKGFLFDGRSGGPLADFVVPNLGQQLEVACWMVHDANGYDLYLSFEDTNEMLRQMLILAGRNRLKAHLIKRAVGLSKEWFGQPKQEDREYANVIPFCELIRVRHVPKIYPNSWKQAVHANPSEGESESCMH